MRHAATIILAIVVAAAPVAVGSVHTSVIACLLAGLVVAGAMSLAARRGDGLRTWISLPAILGFGLALWSGLQLIPLPLGLLSVLQSTGADIFVKGWELAMPGESIGMRPLSMDPAETADRGLRWLTLGLASWVAANLPDERRWRATYIMVVVSGLLALVVGATNIAFDPTTFFGLYEPTVSFRGPSPFVSTNHAAAFYGICGIVGFGGLALRRENHPFEASAAGALGLLFIALAALHDSDAVMAAMGLAVVVFVVGLVVRASGAQLRQMISTQAGRLAYGGIVAVCLLLLAWWLGAIDVLTGMVMSPLEGSESAVNRTEIALGALSASKDYAVAGAGGGAVDVTVGRYIDWTALRPASIPVVENDPVEWLLTYGWLAGGAAILALVIALGMTVRRLMSSARGERWIVASALLVFGAAISLFHFPFFALGVSLPLLVAVDGMTAPRRSPDEVGVSKSGHIAVPGWFSIGVLVVCVGAGGGFFWSNASWQVEFDDDPGKLVRARPSDGRVYAELASRVVNDDPDRAVELARWSAELDRAPDAQVFLARMLGKTGNDEESSRLYAELLASPIQAQMVRYEWIVSDLERPTDRAKVLERASGPRIEGAVRRIATMEGPEAATDVVLELSDLRGDDPAVHRAAVDTFLALGAFDLAELWAESVREQGVADDGVPIGPALLAKVAIVRGDRERAREVAARALQAEQPGERIALVFLGVLPEVTSPGASIADVERAMKIACQSPLPKGRRRPCWLAEAWLHEKGSEIEEAELVFQRIASRLDEPTFLAHFWVRQGRCLQLKRYVENMRDGAKRQAVERIAKTCRS